MSALEAEIIEKISQLDETARQRVLQFLTTPQLEFDWQTWFRNIDVLKAKILTENPHYEPIDVVSTLRELRDGDDE